MDKQREKFLKILRIEMEDLENDIALLEDVTERRNQEHEITDYVLMENMALLKKELGCVHTLLQDLDAFPLEQYDSLEETAQGVKGFFREETKKHGFPPAVYQLVDRKIEKVARYVGNIK